MADVLQPGETGCMGLWEKGSSCSRHAESSALCGSQRADAGGAGSAGMVLLELPASVQAGL